LNGQTRGIIVKVFNQALGLCKATLSILTKEITPTANARPPRSGLGFLNVNLILHDAISSR
jgi:hypothetical protein